MTNRVTYAPQDFQQMCKQAERDHETKKLAVLMERVKRQIAEHGSSVQNRSDNSNGSVTAIDTDTTLRLPSRSVPLER